MGLGSKKALPEDLIESLDEVAAAVSAKRSLDEVLDTIVERAKSITHTDKAVLCLTHEDDWNQMDVGHLAVRGCRDEHAESWWLGALRDAGAEAFNGGGRVQIRDREIGSVMLVVPVRLADHPIGLLGAINPVQQGFSASDEAFLSVLGSFAAVAIENTRMAEESRYVLLSSERSRIAREMHDGLSQSLFSLSLGLELCKRQLWQNPAGVESMLTDLQSQLKSAMDETRRYIYDLRPLKLSELGLVGAIKEWVREITMGRELTGSVTVDGEPVLLGADIELCLYRIAKEAVSNSVKHARPSKVSVTLSYAPADVRLTVLDDGCGFDVAEVVALAGIDGGMGLRDMHVWAERARGRLEIDGTSGRGTRVAIDVPLGGVGQ